MVEPSRLLAAARAAGEALAAAARADVSVHVPSCPEWTVADLLAHTGTFTAQFLGRMQGANTNGPWSEEVPPQDERPGWYLGLHRELVAEFERIERRGWDSAEPRAGLVRRWAHEIGVHSWDARLAAGDHPLPLDADVAADGVEEMFDVFMRPPFWDSPRSPRTLHLHATDVEGEWLLRFDGDAVRYTREHAKGDAAIRGTASDLHLFLWGRVRLADLELFGDESVLSLLRGA